MGRLLAIESSCDETAAAVVTTEGVVLSNAVHSQVPIHAQYGGVVPELASRSHLTAMRPIIAQALGDADTRLSELEAIAVTTGPGLSGCLLVGLQAAKGLAWSLGVPLVPVDHIQAHVHAVYLRDDQGAGLDVPPGSYLALAVSGGHTSLCVVDGPGVTRTLGQTIDDAAGEAFDKVAKMMGLPYPGGVHIDRLARSGRPDAVAMPRPMLRRGLDFSFSGLKTAARLALEARPAMGADEMADFAASVQEAIVDVLAHKAMEACAVEGIRDLVVAGGVACNSRLRAVITERAVRAGVNAYLTPARYCTDNAAMIGGLGAALLAGGASLEGPALLAADIYVTTRPPQSPAPQSPPQPSPSPDGPSPKGPRPATP